MNLIFHAATLLAFSLNGDAIAGRVDCHEFDNAPLGARRWHAALTTQPLATKAVMRTPLSKFFRGLKHAQR